MASSLRSVVMRAGAYLSLRQGLGMGINFGGIILLTRTIGPESYGLYAVALGITYFLLVIFQWGTGVYLVRREGEEREEIYHQAFTLLLLLGAGGTSLAVLGIPLLQDWVRLSGFDTVALAMFLSLPVALLTKVPLARLERALDYRKVAVIELSGMAVYYMAALPLAFGGFNTGAPVVGWWAQQALLLILLYVAARYRPRLHWDSGLVKNMVGYGLSFSASLWVWQLRDLVNPLVVGRYLGAEAAAYVDLSIRFVRGLSFVKEAMWRISIAALGRIQQDRSRLARAVNEGMELQLLAQGPLLVGFGWVAVWLLPVISGSEWRPVMDIYPFIALSYLANAVFNLHSSALYVLRRNFDVVMFHITHVFLFAGSAILLVPRVGLIGYGLAEVVALLSYAVIHVCFARTIGTLAYRLVAVWWGVAAMALFVYELGWWMASGLIVAALWPRTWRQLGSYVKSMRVGEA